MKSTDRTINLLSSLQVLWLNLRYATKTYLYTHVLFTAPDTLYLLTSDDNSELTRKIVVYTCLMAWFGYGLSKTSQPKFVAVIAVLFIWSQHAYFIGNFKLDLFLTLTCVLLMCIKQYVNRYYFAILQQLNDKTNEDKQAGTR